MLCNHTDNTCHKDCFQVTLTTADGFGTLKCGCRPWIRRVPVCVYNLVNNIITPRACARGKVIGRVVVVVVVVSTKIAIFRDTGI